MVLRSLPFEAGGMGMMGSMGGMSGMGGMGGMGRMGGMGGRSGMGMGGGNGMMGRGMMGMGMMGMGMMGMGSTLPIGAAFDILTIKLGKRTTSKPVLGPLPALSMRYDQSNVPNYSSPRPFTLSMGHMMTWTINGRVYEPEAVAEDEKVNSGEAMAWEWVNNSPIPHPMHIHNVQFQVVAAQC